MVAFSLVYKVGVICQVSGAEYSLGHQLSIFFPVFLPNFMNTESSEYGPQELKYQTRAMVVSNPLNTCVILFKQLLWEKKRWQMENNLEITCL